jgi:hypothetical protein
MDAGSKSPPIAQWEKLRENDQVNVTYHIGKYTGTVWGAEID